MIITPCQTVCFSPTLHFVLGMEDIDFLSAMAVNDNSRPEIHPQIVDMTLLIIHQNREAAGDFDDSSR